MKVYTPITVEFYDVDSMNVAWHGHYARYFEVARCDYLEKMGFTYLDMTRHNYAFPVINLTVKYVAPCRFRQKIIVATERVPSDNLLIFKYRITDAESGGLICKGETRQMCVSLKEQKSFYEIPAEIRALFKDGL